MIKEVWKEIKDYEGIYEVSNMGRIKSLANNKNEFIKKRKKEKILKPIISKINGYSYINLRKNKQQRSFLIHRIVAMAFVDNKDNFLEVHHKNNIKTDNRSENLIWISKKENKELRIFNRKDFRKEVLEQVLNFCINAQTKEDIILFLKKEISL